MALVAVAVVASMAWAVNYRGGRDSDVAVVAPADYFPDLWRSVLGGDQAMNEARYARLADPSASDLGEVDARSASETGARVVLAQLTGRGREAWPDYFAAIGPAVSDCQARILAAGATALPVAQTGAGAQLEWAKVVVAWDGRCGAVSGTVSVPQLEYVYLAREGTGAWIPLSEAQVPRSAGQEASAASGALPAWALEPLGRCGNAGSGREGLEARPEVVAAFAVLCQAAKADGVTLVVTSAYRDPSDQAQRYAAAKEAYGSSEAARRWVASSQGERCTSRHCAGAALDVENEPAALAWLTATVGCRSAAGVRQGTACGAGEGAVKRVDTYGFTIPLVAQPWHLEYSLPLLSVTGYCTLPTGASVPELIAEVWRCEVRSGGLTGAEATDVARSAVMVAKCVSGWAPSWVSSAGAYVATPNPATGQRETFAGVFGLDEAVAGRYLEGGYGRVSDALANITAASHLYLSERGAGRDGWAYWGSCAEGTPARGVTAPEWVTIY